MNADFPKLITLLRKERKTSQKQAAADLGISQALLSHYEKGIRECGLDFLIKIADYYSVSCDYLLGRTSSSKAYFHESSENAYENEQKIKLIADSAETVISLSEKYGNPDMQSHVTDSIMLTLYKLLRMICGSSTGSSLFRISDVCSENFSDCTILKKSAMLKKTSGAEHMTAGSSSLEEDLPHADSLMALVNSAEEIIIREIPGAG